jgi:hypothetical protein
MLHAYPIALRAQRDQRAEHNQLTCAAMRLCAKPATYGPCCALVECSPWRRPASSARQFTRFLERGDERLERRCSCRSRRTFLLPIGARFVFLSTETTAVRATVTLLEWRHQAPYLVLVAAGSAPHGSDRMAVPQASDPSAQTGGLGPCTSRHSTVNWHASQSTSQLAINAAAWVPHGWRQFSILAPTDRKPHRFQRATQSHSGKLLRTEAEEETPNPATCSSRRAEVYSCASSKPSCPIPARSSTCTSIWRAP